MNESYTYYLTPAAMEDLDGALSYIAHRLHAKDSAIRLLDKIQDAIESACRHPHATTPVNDVLLKARGYRKLIEGNYIILFIPDDEQRVLNVMRVVYYAKDYLKEL